MIAESGVLVGGLISILVRGKRTYRIEVGGAKETGRWPSGATPMASDLAGHVWGISDAAALVRN